MRYSIILLLLLLLGQCSPQTKYDEKLSLRLDQIRKLDFYDNSIVINIDSVEYHDMSFPYWKPNDIYYQDDIVRYKYSQYAALKETKGQRPDTSRTGWKLVMGPHPYLFLRDSARIDDLQKLLM